MPEGVMLAIASRLGFAIMLSLAALAASAHAEGETDKSVTIYAINVDGTGAVLGSLTLTDTRSGLRIMPSLDGLTPGLHGMHVHEKPDCGPAKKDGAMTAGLKAGGHLDPAGTGMHEGPFGKGHLGDLPYLSANAEGRAKIGVVAPRLKLADIVGHAIIIHEGADNYSDTPNPLGGGGGRIACGVVE
jgi:Cu-Zn family superoxide dismutase